MICENVIAIVSKTNKGKDALFVKASVKHGVIRIVLALVSNLTEQKPAQFTLVMASIYKSKKTSGTSLALILDSFT